jgi:lipoprotein-releasing system permease protein
MLEWLSQGLGFVSASLVALIALAFGAMFVFFSGSAALILAHFLRFVRAPRLGLLCIGLAAVLATLAGLAADVSPFWLAPAVQTGCALVCWLLSLAQPLHRWLRWGVGIVFVICGLLFIAALGLPSLIPLGLAAVRLVTLVLLIGGIGLWPLVLGGLVVHRLQRAFEWWISTRYLVARRRQTVISIISGICVVGVALGVAVITVVLSVMNGFSRMWEEKIIGSRAHFSIHSSLGEYPDYLQLRERILKVPGVQGATPSLASEAIVRGDSGQIQSVILKGIDPGTVGSATELVEIMRQGSLDDLDPLPDAEGLEARHGVILGEELANRFFLRIGDPLVLISPLGGRPTPLGPAPRMERFRVAGVFRSDFFQFDEGYIYTSLAGAQQFMKLGDVVSAIEVRTPDAYRSGQVARAASAALGGSLYYTRDWKDFYPGFFQALKTERVMMFVLLSFIMVVAGFIIVATLIMMIMEKSRDIAILKTMGCDDDGILRVFAIQGFMIGTVGLALGVGMGLVITINLDVIQRVVEGLLGIDVLPANVYQLAGLPYDIEPSQLGIIALIAMTLSIGATLLPSWQAAHLDPAEGLRYE